MFVVLTYDIEVKRINKVRKILKKYLIWVQNSVFEGNITEGKLNQCLAQISQVVNKQEDSIYIYCINDSKLVRKDIMGNKKNFDDMFL